MKKEYVKPEVDYIKFYSTEEMTAEIDAGLSGGWTEEENPWG